jgi:hypothetical protein
VELRADFTAELVAVFETNKFNHHGVYLIFVVLEMLVEIRNHFFDDKLKVFLLQSSIFDDVSHILQV